MIILTNTLEANVRTCIKTHNTISPPNLRKENDKFMIFGKNISQHGYFNEIFMAHNSTFLKWKYKIIIKIEFP
jgi:hypothetical protein